MFGSKSTSSNNSNTTHSASGGATNSLVSGTSVEGTITASKDIRIDGTLNGNLNCSGKVIIGPEGRVVGEIICDNAVIEGHFEGKLKVKNTVTVKESANVKGEVDTENLQVNAGAVFNVQCNAEPSKVKTLQKETA